MEERRRSPRRKVLKPGRIVFNGGFSVITCTLRDLSEHGAKLHMPSPVGIPLQFNLHFDSHSVPCRIVRKQADTVGVEFE